MTKLTCSLLAVALLAGCGTEIRLSSGTGAGGEGGDATGGQGGAGGGTAGSGGGINPACPTPTDDRFELAATLGGQSLGCDFDFWNDSGEATVSGVVVASWDGYLAIDSCPPNAFCDSAVNEINFSASEMFNPIQAGTLVKATVRMDVDWSCRHQLLITNLPHWEGLTNPISRIENVWLAGSDGGIDTIAGAPFSAELVEIACDDPDRTHYQLRFDSAASHGPLTLSMGESDMWYLPSADGDYSLEVKNLSSYEWTNVEDAGFNGAFWMATQIFIAFDTTSN